MKNDKRDLNLIVQTIEELGCYNNPGPAAAVSAKFIDETYVLIPREVLPQISFGSLDDAFSGVQKAQLASITEHVFNGDAKKMRDLAYQYLSMASYVDGKKEMEQIESAKRNRFAVFQDLFPESTCTLDNFQWSSMTKFERDVIDKMVLLNIELADAKKKS